MPSTVDVQDSATKKGTQLDMPMFTIGADGQRIPATVGHKSQKAAVEESGNGPVNSYNSKAKGNFGIKVHPSITGGAPRNISREGGKRKIKRRLTNNM